MITRHHLVVAATAFLLLTGSAAPARADWLLTPFVGWTFGGDTSEEHLVYGGSIGFMGGGVFGFEFDAGIAPDILSADGDVDFDITDSSAVSLMGNLIVGIPLGEPGVRPYVTGGAGLLRTRLTNSDQLFDDIEDNSFGINFGGGIMAFFSDNFGLRGDVRYFRSLQDIELDDDFDIDLGSFDFWRATVGATFRF